MTEMLLPGSIRAKADIRGNEYGWHRTDLPALFDASRAQGLAAVGGQVQFRLPGGTCELYWHSFDSNPREQGEDWGAYVARSRHEVLEALSHLPSEQDLVSEGEASFEFLREQKKAGADLAIHLWYVCYFAAQSDE